jgi:hypothetical protein
MEAGPRGMGLRATTGSHRPFSPLEETLATVTRKPAIVVPSRGLTILPPGAVADFKLLIFH